VQDVVDAPQGDIASGQQLAGVAEEFRQRRGGEVGADVGDATGAGGEGDAGAVPVAGEDQRHVDGGESGAEDEDVAVGSDPVQGPVEGVRLVDEPVRAAQAEHVGGRQGADGEDGDVGGVPLPVRGDEEPAGGAVGDDVGDGGRHEGDACAEQR